MYGACVNSITFTVKPGHVQTEMERLALEREREVSNRLQHAGFDHKVPGTENTKPCYYPSKNTQVYKQTTLVSNVHPFKRFNFSFFPRKLSTKLKQVICLMSERPPMFSKNS